ncbi:hypothetical protein SDC9_162402 [bioreactor metagenome]|uniref:Uncharacterized protein n=1 Tax=bioreactor metagenome TaxID=1076179 RepID=A0A645FSL6_9ZZZZ
MEDPVQHRIPDAQPWAVLRVEVRVARLLSRIDAHRCRRRAIERDLLAPDVDLRSVSLKRDLAPVWHIKPGNIVARGRNAASSRRAPGLSHIGDIAHIRASPAGERHAPTAGRDPGSCWFQPSQALAGMADERNTVLRSRRHRQAQSPG